MPIKNFKLDKSEPLIKRLASGVLRELIIPICMALIVIQFGIQAFRIPSGSMKDTLLIGDFILGLKFVYGIDLPFTDSDLPGFTDPEPGDVVIFKYPGEPQIPDYNHDRYTHLANLLLFGNYYWDHEPQDGHPSLVRFPEGPKDFIKRCVAKGGQTLEIVNRQLFVDSLEVPLPEEGKFTSNHIQPIVDNFGPIRLPRKGETISFDTLSLAQLYQTKSLLVQENPDDKILLEIDFYKDGQPANDFVFDNFLIFSQPSQNTLGFIMSQINPQLVRGMNNGLNVSFSLFKDYAKTGFLPHRMPEPGMFRLIAYEYFSYNLLDDLEKNITMLNEMAKASLSFTDSTMAIDTTVDTTITTPKYEIKYKLTRNGQDLQEYTLEEDTYFMLGDNRHNSADSRYWGLVSGNNIKAKAFIIYYSFDDDIKEIDGRAVPTGPVKVSNPFSWLLIPFHTRWDRVGKLIHGI